MGATYRGPHRGYELTDEDVLWLARAFVGEAGNNVTPEEASALFHCWLDRLLLVKGKWANKWSLADMIRAHSQPCNPKWTNPSPALCAKHPTHCTPAKIRRRKQIQALTVAKLEKIGASTSVYALALKAQDGSLGRTIDEPTYDFAACSLTKKQSRPNPGINVGGNCFLPYSSLKPKEAKAVYDENAQVVSGIAAHSGPAVLLGTALVAIGVGMLVQYLEGRTPPK